MSHIKQNQYYYNSNVNNNTNELNSISEYSTYNKNNNIENQVMRDSINNNNKNSDLIDVNKQANQDQITISKLNLSNLPSLEQNKNLNSHLSSNRSNLKSAVGKRSIAQ